MKIMDLFRRKQNKEVFSQMTQDEKDIKKADEDIKEKGKDGQTEADRRDESVAAQEKADGDENLQDAKDRIDESEGAKKADEEKGKTDETDEEKNEDKSKDKMDVIIEKLDGLFAMLAKASKEDEKDDGEEAGIEENQTPPEEVDETEELKEDFFAD